MKQLLAHLRFPLASILVGILAPISSAVAAEAAQTTDTVIYTTLVRPDEAVDLDLAKLNAIDSNLRTTFHFPGGDLYPTVIVELAQTDQIHRVSTVYKAEGAHLDVYLLNELPKHPGNLRALKPIASIVDLTNRGEAVVDFAPTGGRYVALQWTRQESESEPFYVTEISAFAAVALIPDFSDELETLPEPPTIASVSP